MALPGAVLDLLDVAGQHALSLHDPEQAIHTLARACHELLGDRTAHLRDGALDAGQTQFFVAGAFFVTPDEQHHMLVGNEGFPPEQRRLMIPIDGGHPAWVRANRKPLILANTAEHGSFRRYLKTSRMGSAIYAPMIWRDRFLGQMIMAAQARHTMRDIDLRALVAVARLATAAWVAHGGPQWLIDNPSPPDAFRVDGAGLQET